MSAVVEEYKKRYREIMEQRWEYEARARNSESLFVVSLAVNAVLLAVIWLMV